MKNIVNSIITSAIVSLFFLVSCNSMQESDYVDPLIGTGGHGHTYPGAALPFGMVQLSPDTRLTGWDGCSGYHYSDSVIYGFSHTHLSGTGVSDYADILLMPLWKNVYFDKGSPENRKNGYCSLFSHDNETAKAGYYQVFLSDHKINVELTATQRAGFHRYTYPKPDSAIVLIDLTHRDYVIDSYIKVISNTEIEGFRRSKEWAQDQYVYFVARFSEPFTLFEIKNDSILTRVEKEQRGKQLKAALHFNLPDGKNKQLLVKVGISGVDAQGARKNLDTEISGWNFDSVATAARNTWQKNLERIKISGGTTNQKTIFYTALYHSLLNPNLYTDVDGRFRTTDLKIHENEGFTNYTVFSLWDTYRATHPLFTIIEPERTLDFIKTFLAQYKYGGRLPVWELAANETNCMIGYHSVPVIADAYIKGITDFDTTLALEAMLHASNLNHFGLDDYKNMGYIPLNTKSESVSKTLEYAYDDWTIAQFAKAIGNIKVYGKYMERAQYYKNIFDVSTGFMRPKANGAWLYPFDAREVNCHFTEANSWQYSFYVPQDLSGLMNLHGGPGYFVQKLDSLFTTNSETTGREQADITGLIGQYAHGNEPSHHMAYLYAFAGQPYKTQMRVHEIMNTQYFNAPDGLSGNEDCGQMSAWFVFSAMGFYPVTPGSDLYIIGTPLFNKVQIKLDNGKVFTVKANKLSDKNIYIQSAKLNNKPYNLSYIKHSNITNGDVLEFEMGSEPGKIFGIGSGNLPVSEISEHLIPAVPFFGINKRTFSDSLLIKIASPDPTAKIYYAVNQSNSEKYQIYSKPFYIGQSATISAFTQNAVGVKSFVTQASYLKIPKGRTIKINSKYNKQYNAGGNDGLIDYIRGGTDFTNGSWQGYQDTDFEAVVDLGKLEKISFLAAGFLHDIRPWIWLPTEVTFEVSVNAVNFEPVLTKKHNVKNDDYTVQALDIGDAIKPINTRYIRVKAKNFGTIPDWHPGRGGEAFIFIDEIIIR